MTLELKRTFDIVGLPPVTWSVLMALFIIDHHQTGPRSTVAAVSWTLQAQMRRYLVFEAAASPARQRWVVFRTFGALRFCPKRKAADNLKPDICAG
jgi:hypothetical protein